MSSKGLRKANGKTGTLPARPPPSALVSAKAAEKAEKVLQALKIVEARRNSKASVSGAAVAKACKANGLGTGLSTGRRPSASHSLASEDAENLPPSLAAQSSSPGSAPSLPEGTMVLSPVPVPVAVPLLGRVDRLHAPPPVHLENTPAGSASITSLVSPGVQHAIERAMAAADGAVMKALQQSMSMRGGGGGGVGAGLADTVRSRTLVSPELWARAQGSSSSPALSFTSWPREAEGEGHTMHSPSPAEPARTPSSAPSPLSPTADDAVRSPRPSFVPTALSSSSSSSLSCQGQQHQPEERALLVRRRLATTARQGQQGEGDSATREQLITVHAGVEQLRCDHSLLRAQVSSLLSSTQQAMAGLGEQVQGQVLALTRECRQAQQHAHVLGKQHSAAVEACESLRARVLEVECQLAAQREEARVLRDSVAHAVGCVRVIVRMRPLLASVDLREGSPIPLLLRWCMDRHCAHVRQEGKAGGGGGILMGKVLQLARLMGWQGDAEALCAALKIDPTSCTGTLSPPTSEHGMDISPALLPLGASTGGWHALLACPGEVHLPVLWQGQEALCAKLRREGSVYSYDRVLGPREGQGEVWDEVRPALAAWLGKGRCVTVMAYGASGSGKSHTLLGTEAEPGLIPRALDFLHTGEADRGAGAGAGAGAGGGGRTAYLSILEVAGDKVVDLLKAGAGEAGVKLSSLPHTVTDPAGPGISFLALPTFSPGACLQVGGQERQGQDSAHICRIVREVMGKRVTASTLVNPTSSRGHVLVRILLPGKPPARSMEGYKCGYESLPLLGRMAATTGAGEGHGQAWLHLVDLAGCESVRDSGVSGAALAQTCTVHSDLGALGRVISALAQGKKHIPCRDAKLTKVLEHALCTPAAQTVLIATASMSPYHREQSRACLSTAACMAGTPVRPLHEALEDRVREALGGIMSQQEIR